MRASAKAIPYALGALLLGVLGLTSGDFAFQWQPVPDTVPLRPELAYLSAAAMADCSWRSSSVCGPFCSTASASPSGRAQ